MRKTIIGALLMSALFALLRFRARAFRNPLRQGLSERAGATTPGFAVDKDLRVMEQTAGGNFNAGSAPSGATLKSIFCFRSDIVPAPGDYKVVNAGYPLMIYSRDNESAAHRGAGNRRRTSAISRRWRHQIRSRPARPDSTGAGRLGAEIHAASGGAVSTQVLMIKQHRAS